MGLEIVGTAGDSLAEDMTDCGFGSVLSEIGGGCESTVWEIYIGVNVVAWRLLFRCPGRRLVTETSMEELECGEENNTF